ncbi:MAG: RHS repeat-associated core domain-containing protein [Saprospiraceae bacterium]|nr:RHS repeat-associated core domain-containing protein [Saprospiraceae bacterium]
MGGAINQQLANNGFKDNQVASNDYTYDENGNVTYDANKGVTMTYNHLNLPTRFEWTATKYIDITYDAAGVKLTKTKTDNGTITTKHYVGGIEYDGTELEAVYHAEGRAMYSPFSENAINNFVFEYSIKDHLGNSRVMFSDLDGNGQVTEAEIIQVEHYYPFGMKQEGHGNAIISETNYTYNGKELNSDFGLDLHDYGARWYDAAIGRWHGVDPLAEAFIVHSPYNYGVNNPIMMVDPDGKQAEPVQKRPLQQFPPDAHVTPTRLQTNELSNGLDKTLKSLTDTQLYGGRGSSYLEEGKATEIANAYKNSFKNGGTAIIEGSLVDETWGGTDEYVKVEITTSYKVETLELVETKEFEESLTVETNSSNELTNSGEASANAKINAGTKESGAEVGIGAKESSSRKNQNGSKTSETKSTSETKIYVYNVVSVTSVKVTVRGKGALDSNLIGGTQTFTLPEQRTSFRTKNKLREASTTPQP